MTEPPLNNRLVRILLIMTASLILTILASVAIGRWFGLSFIAVFTGLAILVPLFCVAFWLFVRHQGKTTGRSRRIWQAIGFASGTVIVVLLCIAGYLAAPAFWLAPAPEPTPIAPPAPASTSAQTPIPPASISTPTNTSPAAISPVSTPTPVNTSPPADTAVPTPASASTQTLIPPASTSTPANTSPTAIGTSPPDTPEPTPTAPPATNTPWPANLPELTQSRGLGLSRDAWEELYGEGIQVQFGYTVYAGKYIVQFQDGNAQSVGLEWPDEGVGIEHTRTERAKLISLDAEFVKQYNPQESPELTVELYTSEWLKSRFTEDAWTGGQPGDFTIVYSVDDGAIKRMIVATGNNP